VSTQLFYLTGVKTCLSALGFGNYAELVEFDGPYSLWETVVVRCKDGSAQSHPDIDTETLTCV